MANREQVVVAVFDDEVRPLGLLVDAVGRQQRRQQFPSAQVRGARAHEPDVAGIEARLRRHHVARRDGAEFAATACVGAGPTAAVALEEDVHLVVGWILEHERVAEGVDDRSWRDCASV